MDEEGNLLICCLQNTRIGNLNEKDFHAIWNGSEAENFRKGLMKNRPYKHCRDCRLLFPERKENYENLINLAKH